VTIGFPVRRDFRNWTGRFILPVEEQKPYDAPWFFRVLTFQSFHVFVVQLKIENLLRKIKRSLYKVVFNFVRQHEQNIIPVCLPPISPRSYSSVWLQYPFERCTATVPGPQSCCVLQLCSIPPCYPSFPVVLYCKHTRARITLLFNVVPRGFAI